MREPIAEPNTTKYRIVVTTGDPARPRLLSIVLQNPRNLGLVLRRVRRGIRVREVEQSLSLVEQILDRLPEGSIAAPVTQRREAWERWYAPMAAVRRDGTGALVGVQRRVEAVPARARARMRLDGAAL